MITAAVRYTAAAATHCGKKRATNEDAFGYSEEDGIYIVCDGMGGAAGGEVASSLAVEELLRKLCCPKNGLRASQDWQQTAARAVESANRAIFQRSQRSATLRGMGTTVVAVAACDDTAWVLNIGDSRCYLLRDGSLRLITEDHSLVEEQVRAGRMTRAEALRSPMRNIITRALGTQPSITPDIFQIQTRPGDRILLCSDGLTREVSEPHIAAVLSADPAPDQICQSLIAAANNAGGSDNITCVVISAA